MAHFNHNKIISDIKELIKLLKKYQFESRNSIELFRLDNIIGKSREVFYTYNSEDIVFNVTTSGMDVKPTVEKISVTLNTKYTLVKVMSKTSDIFEEYNWNIYIKGYPGIDDSPEEFSNLFCWHLDRELNTDGNYSHPYYHFHAGGNHIHDRELGNLLMISSPRIPHPPMDIFISIHFIITNFFSTKDFPEQKKILADDNYISIIQRAQKRVLDPYFSTISGTTHTNFTPHNLFPLLYDK
ncbi:MAG: hypothetical protein UR43_C0021G0003 [candidate division TM6 bacterium GW2011_GWF2_33_332]|nr:MAG: hypothetical protein UR43_C0021G0003 [candidate division TM6 bacterium GW2011_GWF2_33_332]